MREQFNYLVGAISVIPEQLKSQAKDYTQSQQQIQDAIRKVNSTNQQIAQEWKGQAFQSYIEQYNQLEGNVKKMEELLISINSQLNKYADTVAQRDQQDASSFGLN
ncbi:WXG100 family type VII secretion target [Enterococcus plantarum]|uniref:WXG100 family type VII secretion target n=1 Tax=Enterococcus plantarum TaxID=1077675 RepID=UPI001A8C29BB|nr:WXG100 family type VII secretion target [Enterococcus plantarum]MBO0466102.1 WXG100 family type VII secretion target [Enterococcus plantarum]